MTIALGALTLPDKTIMRPRRAMMILSLFGALGFVVLAGWMLVLFPAEPHVWLGAALGIPFFGWAAIVAVKRIVSGFTSVVDRDGFTVAGPALNSKRVAWRDVDKIFVFNVARQKLVGVRLNNTNALVMQYSSKDVLQMLARDKWLARFMAATPSSGAVSTGDVARAKYVTGPCADIAEYFRRRREAYGCEIMLGWPERDRGADAFAALLESYRVHV